MRDKFKKMYLEEFDDPNESFMDFLLDLIPKEILIEVIILLFSINISNEKQKEEKCFSKNYWW